MKEIAEMISDAMPFAFILGLVWMVLFFRDRRSSSEAMKPGGEVAVGLEALANKMEKRIDALEQILDAEAPGWRKRHHEH